MRSLPQENLQEWDGLTENGYVTKARNQIRPGTRHHKGFTLLETVMSMYILLVGVLVFSGMAVFSNKVALQAKTRSAAYQVARQQMETLKSTSFDRLFEVSDTTFDIPQEVIDALPGKTNTKYEVQGMYNVTDISPTMKQANVRIRWRNAAAVEGQVAPWSEVRLGTLLCRPGSITNPLPTPTNAGPALNTESTGGSE